MEYDDLFSRRIKTSQKRSGPLSFLISYDYRRSEQKLSG
jgi:hypothetical protein